MGRGTREMMLQAEAGLKLFQEAKELEGDKGAAEARGRRRCQDQSFGG